MKHALTLCCLIIWCILPAIHAKADVFDFPVDANNMTNASNIAIVKKTIPQPTILKSNFTQTKAIEGLSKTFQSKGSLIYAKEKGFYWKIKHPFDATYIVTPKGLMQIENGKETIIPTKKHAFFREFSVILQSIFSGEYSKLSQHFDLFFYRLDKKDWILGLRPSNDIIKKIIKEIKITGNKHIHTIFFNEKNGDSTSISLDKQHLSPLTKEEEDYFDF